MLNVGCSDFAPPSLAPRPRPFSFSTLFPFAVSEILSLSKGAFPSQGGKSIPTVELGPVPGLVIDDLAIGRPGADHE